MIVLDTNVLSEALKPAPDRNLGAWLAAQTAASLFATAVSQAEMLYGVALLTPGRRRDVLRSVIDHIFESDFAGRVLSFDSAAARAFAIIATARRRAGQPMGPFDAQIAAIALSRNASVATRDVGDFAGCGVPIIDPWRS
jgi:predicted nucleic acid-binding protein